MKNSILDYAPGKLRKQQKAALLEVESSYDSHDVFVIVAPTATGKSWMAVTIAEWLKAQGQRSAVITPTKLLQDQYSDEFDKYPNLKGRSSYSCIESDKQNCDEKSLIKIRGGRSVRKACPGCPYVATRERAQTETITFANYHTYFANQLFMDRPNLIIDEAHNVEAMLTDMFSVELWQHKDLFPTNIAYLGDLAVWMETKIKSMEKVTELTKLEESKLNKYRMCVEEIRHNAKNYHFEHNIKKYRGTEQRQIVVKPLSPRNVPKILWPSKCRDRAGREHGGVEKIVLLSATLTSKDVQELGLNFNRVKYINCDSPIPPENRAFVVDPKIDMGYWKRAESMPKLAELLLELADKHNDKGLVHMTYATAKQLKPMLAENDRFIFHTATNKMKVYQEFRESDENQILVAAGMSEGIDLAEDAGRWQVIPLIPYINMSDAWVKSKMTSDQAWYNWMAIRTIQQQTGRICRTPTDVGITYMLDSRFAKLFYKTTSLWPTWFQESIKWED